MIKFSTFPAGNSEAARTIRGIDWASSPLGPMDRWPAELRTYLNFILNSPESMYLVWGEELWFFHNDAYTPVLGPRQAHAQGAKMRELWVDVWDQVSTQITNALNGIAYQCEDMPLSMARYGKLERTWWSFSFSPLLDGQGQVVGLLCVTQETTQRVLDQRALRSSESRRLALIADLERQVTERAMERGLTWQVSPDLLSVMNTERRFESVNPAWQRVLGWSAEDIEHLTATDLIHPDDLQSSLAAFAALDRNQPVLNFENRYRCRNGDYRWLSWVAVPEGGKMYCSARDITNEKLQKVALIERTAELDCLWRISPDLLSMIDFQGRFLRVNPAWETLLGLTPESLIGQTVTEHVHPDDLALSTAALDQAVRGVLPLVENRYRHRDGSYRWIAWTAASHNGVVFGIGKDMTEERKRSEALHATEEALRQAQKMEAVGQLTGGLAHDFNNLLMGMSGNIELLRMRVAQYRTEDLGRYITAALEASRRAASLTHRLLAFSRRQTLDPKPTDINQLVDGMAELIDRTVGPAIVMQVRHNEGLWRTLVDAHQLENALLNLCLNARDAMPDGGTLIIETGNQMLNQQAAADLELEPGRYVSLCVSDTGSGMPPDVLKRAFDPFFTTKPMGMGTGLGLSMIYGFARQSGGGVSIRSTVGEGSRLCLYLPARDCTPAPRSNPLNDLPKTPMADNENVLVVDDEPSLRLLITEVLEELGYRVIAAQDAATALPVLQSSTRVDLLVTDVGLPGGMNGRQLADAARSLRPRLKVLLITGYADASASIHDRLGPDMHMLTKPFSIPDLSERITSLLRAAPEASSPGQAPTADGKTDNPAPRGNPAP